MMQSLVKFKNKKKGFTLVELIVVIAIIGILAAIMMPKFFGFTTEAKKSAAISEAKSIRTIAETYYASNGTWSAISAATGASFQVQTGGATPATATYDNSPTFTGSIKTLAGADMAAAGVIANGAFQYTKDSHTATCTADGVVTGN